MSTEAIIIPIDRKHVERKCSFCKAPESKVKALLKSGINDHCICDVCIRKAKEAADSVEVDNV